MHKEATTSMCVEQSDNYIDSLTYLPYIYVKIEKTR